MQRCKWKNLESSKVYIDYHDNEWGIASHDDNYLFEMLILESFHCGLSWLIMLNKRQSFKDSFDSFNAEKIANYNEDKIEELLQNENIIRNRKKILATIDNAKAFLNIKKQYGSFDKYIWSFTNNEVQYYPFDGVTSKNQLSDAVSKSLKKHGFRFMGSITTFSYLEAIGVMNNHAKYCFKYKAKEF